LPIFSSFLPNDGLNWQKPAFMELTYLQMIRLSNTIDSWRTMFQWLRTWRLWKNFLSCLPAGRYDTTCRGECNTPLRSPSHIWQFSYCRETHLRQCFVAGHPEVAAVLRPSCCQSWHCRISSSSFSTSLYRSNCNGPVQLNTHAVKVLSSCFAFGQFKKFIFAFADLFCFWQVAWSWFSWASFLTMHRSSLSSLYLALQLSGQFDIIHQWAPQNLHW